MMQPTCMHAVCQQDKRLQKARRQQLLTTIIPYENDADYYADLHRVLKDDYGVDLRGEQLQSAADNLDQLLGLMA